MSHTMEDHGPGPDRERVDPSEAVTEQFAAITTDTLKDVEDRDRVQRMRDERLRQTTAVAEARAAVQGPFSEAKRVRGEAGVLQKPGDRPSAHPEAKTEPLRRYDGGTTAPQPALDRATEEAMLRPVRDGQTGPMPRLASISTIHPSANSVLK